MMGKGLSGKLYCTLSGLIATSISEITFDFLFFSFRRFVVGTASAAVMEPVNASPIILVKNVKPVQ